MPTLDPKEIKRLTDPPEGESAPSIPSASSHQPKKELEKAKAELPGAIEDLRKEIRELKERGIRVRHGTAATVTKLVGLACMLIGVISLSAHLPNSQPGPPGENALVGVVLLIIGFVIAVLGRALD